MRSFCDFTAKKNEPAPDLGPLDSLLVEGFDSEQIWEEIDMQTTPMLAYVEEKLGELLEDDEDNDDEMEDDDEDSQDEESGKSEEESDTMDFEDEDVSDDEGGDLIGGGSSKQVRFEEEEDDDEDEDEEENQGATSGFKKRPAAKTGKSKDVRSSLNEMFFNIDDMEAFADAAERDAARSDDDDEEGDSDVDLDANVDGEGDPADIMFDDFFDAPPENFGGDGDVSDDEAGKGASSSLESQMSAWEEEQMRLQGQIDELESKIVKPREWDQMGEMSAAKRPADSLLEKDLDFQYAGKVAEAITEEVTHELEELIKQRIIDGVFDDVERKLEDADDRKFVPKEEVSSEKSAMGLAEVYEREYVDKVMVSEGGQTLKEQQLEAKHKEIAVLFASLCHKLDSLTNFHFAPKALKEEANIVTVAPAISMEEIIPMGVSEADRQTAHESYSSKNQGLPTADDEMSREERGAKRRGRKTRKRKKNRKIERREAQIAKQHPESKAAQKIKAKQAEQLMATNRNVQVAKGGDDDATKYGTSKAFFKELQAQQNSSGNAEPAAKKAKTAKANWKL